MPDMLPQTDEEVVAYLGHLAATATPDNIYGAVRQAGILYKRLQNWDRYGPEAISYMKQLGRLYRHFRRAARVGSSPPENHS